MNVVDLKNIVLLVTKKIWSSVNLECKIMSQVYKIMFKQIVAVLFDWRFSYSLFQHGCYIHAVIVFHWFFRNLPSEVLCIISGEYTWYHLPHLFCHNDLFTLQFYACVDDTFLVPNESVQHLLEKWEIIEENIYFCRSISRFISLVFLSASVTLNILSLYQLSLDFESFSVSLFGRFRFWAHTHFPEVICPRYGLGDIIFLSPSVWLGKMSIKWSTLFIRASPSVFDNIIIFIVLSMWVRLWLLSLMLVTLFIEVLLNGFKIINIFIALKLEIGGELLIDAIVPF